MSFSEAMDTRVSRRNFLAAAAFGGLAAQARARWQMPLSVSSLHFLSVGVEEACRRIAALGFEAVDFWPANFKCPHMDEIAGRLGAQRLREVLSRNRLSLSAFTCYLNPLSRYAQILGEAGGGVLIRESKYGQFQNPAVEMQALMESLKPDLELADRHNFDIAIENHSKALLNSLDSFHAFLDLASHPRLGIAIAPYHLQVAGIPVERVIELAGSRLRFFYAWQHQTGLGQLPGHGGADFGPWLEALGKIGYRGYVNPFMHGTESMETMESALLQARKYLEGCRSRIGKA